MNTWDSLMASIRARPGSPAPVGQPADDVPDDMLDAYQKIERARLRGAAAAVKALGLPERAMALLVAGKARETEAVLATARATAIMVLSGTPGCGKTVAAAKWLFDGAVDTQWPGLWLTSARLARWPRYSPSDMDQLLETPRLVIDDLGTEFLDEKGSFMATLDELLNERYAYRRPTILTTNLNLAGFKARYHERIVDRIREDGRFSVIASASLRSE